MQSSAVRYHLFSHPHRHMHTAVPVLAPPNDGSHDCHHLTYGAETSPPCRFDHKSRCVLSKAKVSPASRQAMVSHLALSDGVNPVVSSANGRPHQVARQASSDKDTVCVKTYDNPTFVTPYFHRTLSAVTATLVHVT